MNDAARTFGLGIVGLGVMGKAHVAACRAAAAAGYPVRLAAVCDRNAAKLAGRLDAESNIKSADAGALGFDPREVATFDSAAGLFASPDVDVVSICTRTETHVALAAAALAAGKHVLVEKPIALRATDVLPLLRAAAAAPNLVLMPAMCMRFWPGWDWLKARVEDGAYGAVKSASFHRLGSGPAWSRDFYGDPERSGGALVDLHIHDADFVRHLFGDPQTVSTTGTLDHVTTLYRYGRGGPAHVVAEGGWDHARGFDFRMRYVVVFEHATAEFDLTREEPLRLYRDGGGDSIPIAALNGYDGEIRALIDALREGRPSPVPIGDALAVARLLDAERASLASGAAVAV